MRTRWLSSIIGIVWAQIAGGWSYDFLNVAPSARSAALGGIAWGGGYDLNAAAQNPAYLRPFYHRNFHLTIQPYLADIFMAQLGYAHHWMGVGTFWGGLLYINYGEFRQTDEVGNILGTFYANEGALLIGAARHFGRWHAGMNFKLPFSTVSVDRYYRLGLGTDIGVAYDDSLRGLVVSLVLRNLGAELYRPKGRPLAQPFPTSLQMTLSYRVPHAPFRIHLGAIHLERWRMAYNDPLQPIRYNLSGNPIPPPPPKWTEHLFRHILGGVEAFPEGFIRLRMAYHFQRRRELNPSGSTSWGGMSFGAGMHARRWQVDYAYTLFFRRAAAHTLSLGVRPF
ncbi:MAG: type IX secretion system protein PorQ [Bacteroidia bacterium]